MNNENKMTIASIISKTTNVINSCETAAQLSAAEKFINLASNAIWVMMAKNSNTHPVFIRHRKLETAFANMLIEKRAKLSNAERMKYFAMRFPKLFIPQSGKN